MVVRWRWCLEDRPSDPVQRCLNVIRVGVEEIDVVGGEEVFTLVVRCDFLEETFGCEGLEGAVEDTMGNVSVPDLE
ncbi:hypothetical protein [Halostagnicola sp. A-GB9-2]|uniref:hypothetical protein n=1 Tax=Halostagnicola sp. A-GB9-2 TaxID=3048066 RepID=UPI0024BFE906|nr:hypothetical protein [Halostagnicola sp. A-GB9-2]MDJ1434221.1 hypothetical protein [Halostagnicola sp. A-GB9-2]